MSGEKCQYTRIAESELQRLRQEASQLRSLRQDLPEQLRTVQQAVQQGLQAELAQLHQRAALQEQQAEGLASELRKIEQKFCDRLQVQQTEWQACLAHLTSEQIRATQHSQQVMAHQRCEYLQILEQQRQEYLTLLEQHHQNWQQQQQLLQTQVAEIQAVQQQQQRQQAGLAEDLLWDITTIWQTIHQNYPHQQFAPQRLELLRRNLQFVEQNHRSGQYQAAIALAQQTYLAMTDLRLEIEQREQAWWLLYQATCTEVAQLLNIVAAYHHSQLEFAPGEGVEIDVEYWSQGALGECAQKLQTWQTQLQQGRNYGLTQDQLNQLAAQVQAMAGQIETVVEQARLAVLDSQLRVEIADRIVTVFSQLGYDIPDPDTDATYIEQDPRQPYLVKVRNIAGDQIVTVISPQHEFGLHQISLNTFSPTLIDETATRQNAEAIFQQLAAEGIQATGPLVCQEHPRSEYGELMRVSLPPPPRVSERGQERSWLFPG